MKNTRKQRRENARKNNEVFTPQYNGNKPVTYAEFYGVGYERFDNKFVKVSELLR